MSIDAPARVLQMGEPGLRRISEPVADIADPAFVADGRRLTATLHAFREAHGFGRAISAPQIGVAQRFIAVHLTGRTSFHGLLINPVITWRSEQTFTMWDDCMSFPSILVRLRRHDSISLSFHDERGEARTWTQLDRSTSELLQHEMDHLDGILAVDHAIDRDAIVMREAFEAMPDHFRGQVDYVIGS
ncbi:peptide deformylase [Pendulispora brunnea]|uniref:Peptide deformylase n=1 Tax=Pendulispora brunnea TaxID=2905690 RepID=A0ABZ2JWX8_9BACT